MYRNVYETVGEIVLIPYEKISPRESKLKKYYSCSEISELTSSIYENGLIEPLTVMRIGKEKYRLISGERRYRASIEAGLTKIPCVIISCDEINCRLYSLIGEQQQLCPGYFEEAEYIHRLLTEFDLTISELSEKLCKSEKYIHSKLKLLAIPEELREIMTEHGLCEEYADLILKLSDKGKADIIKKVIEDDLSVSQTAKEIEDYTMPPDRRRNIMYFSNINIFTNTVEKAISTMKNSGIKAASEKKETEEYVEYTVKISKATPRS